MELYFNSILSKLAPNQILNYSINVIRVVYYILPVHP